MGDAENFFLVNAAHYPGMSLSRPNSPSGVSTQHVEHGHTVDTGKGKGEFLFFYLSPSCQVQPASMSGVSPQPAEHEVSPTVVSKGKQKGEFLFFYLSPSCQMIEIF